MRYAQGGGLTDVKRAARERVRLEAVGRFESGAKNREIAATLRVSERSVERWCRQWRERGQEGVRSKDSPGRPRLSSLQIARLERESDRGQLAHGWADQWWTLARVKTLIGRLFHVSYTVEGTWRLLKRHGWSWRRPARRAIERDDDAVELWKKEVWPQVKRGGGLRSLDRLRGRGQPVAEAAARKVLGPHRPDAGRPRPGSRLRTGFDGGNDLLSLRRPVEADLQLPRPPGSQGRTKGVHVAGLEVPPLK